MLSITAKKLVTAISNLLKKNRESSPNVNSIYERESIKDSFQPERLSEIAKAMGLSFDGIEKFDNGTKIAKLQRLAIDGTDYRIVLMLIPQLDNVTAYTALIKNDVAIVESDLIAKCHVYSALQEAISTFDALKKQADNIEHLDYLYKLHYPA